MTKRYDQAYFDRWYRDPRHQQWGRAEVARKVRMVLGIAEYILDRPVRTVLDVGCGEATWQPILKQLRPRIHYLGVDDSEYAVKKYGRSRHVVRGTVGGLSRVKLAHAYDLVVCCDVLHYVPTADVKRGLATMARLAQGVAYLEAYTSADEVTGDHVEFQRRSPASYRRLFAAAGFRQVGPHAYVGPALLSNLVALETPQDARSYFPDRSSSSPRRSASSPS